MIATLYKDKIFYIPNFLDFRGRLYTKVSYLSYQGGDMARSLIQFYSPNDNINKFKDTKNLYNTPINYIKQYAGNVYNLSKKTTKIKIEWCDIFIENMKKEFDIYYISNNSNLSSKKVEVLSRDNVGDKGMSDYTLVGKNKVEQDFDFYFLNKYLDSADEPFQFISVYYAIKDIIINKQYNINIPILFDASCSGVQHLASIACDIKLAKMVNVVGTGHGRSDFYQIAADYVENSINNLELNTGINENLKLIKVTRSILKVPIMTISYNVGLEKMNKNLLEKMGKLVEIDNSIVTENRDDINRILPMDSPELESTPVSLKGVSVEKEKKLESSSGNKIFKIKINKEHSKTEEDLFLSPTE
jgi:DNA-directed RNA polymerase